MATKHFKPTAIPHSASGFVRNFAGQIEILKVDGPLKVSCSSEML